MKKINFLLIAVLACVTLQAQIQAPAASPSAKLEQRVGLTDVTVDYSRPAMRGRTIFGDLVPFDNVWRTGANARTAITFSNDVTVDGQELKAGTYAIFTIPTATTWDVIFYTESDGGGAPAELDNSLVAARTTVSTYQMPIDIQSFTITIDDVTDSSAVIGIMWEKIYVGVKFDVPTDAVVMSSIENTLAGPSGNDYYTAAVYYLEGGKDINQAKTWIDKAISMNETPQYWQLRQQSLIYAKAGDKKGAIKIAKKSLAAAEAANNADYVKLNKDSLKEWGAK